VLVNPSATSPQRVTFASPRVLASGRRPNGHAPTHHGSRAAPASGALGGTGGERGPPANYGSVTPSSPKQPLLLSPELVLVDPELRALALERLPDPPSPVPARSDVTEPNPVLEAVAESAPAARARERSVLAGEFAWLRGALALAAAGALGFVVGTYAAGSERSAERPYLLPPVVSLDPPVAERPAEEQTDAERDVPEEVEATPSVPETALTEPARGLEPPTTKAPAPPPARRRQQPEDERNRGTGGSDTPLSREPPAASSRPGCVTLRWPPAADAAFYNVVLWRGDRRVLDLFPEDPTVQVTRSTPSVEPLMPGRYRWVVYPGFGSRDTPRFGQQLTGGTLVLWDDAAASDC
jgi:hypothetical protein